MITYERIKFLCNKKNISVRQLERDAKLPYGTVGNWKESTPNAEGVVKIANVLSTTTDYLLGVTDDPTIPVQQDEEILSFQRAKNKMSPEKKDLMFNVLKVFFANEFANEFAEDIDFNTKNNKGEQS